MQLIKDHEEWTRIIEGSETGSYVTQAFALHNRDTELLATNSRVAKQVFKRLFKRQGWDLRFVRFVRPLVSGLPLEPDDPRAGKGWSQQVNLSESGCWFADVPVDYLEELDDPVAVAFALEEKPRFLVWAMEEASKRSDGKLGLMLPEFEYTVEQAFVAGRFYQYHDHPDAPKIYRRLMHGQLR